MIEVVTRTNLPWQYDAANEVYRLPGRDPIPFDATPGGGGSPFPARFTAGTEPWRLKEGESHYDGIPAALASRIKYARDFPGVTDLDDLANSISATIPNGTPHVIELDYGVYHITGLVDYDTSGTNPNFIGTSDKARDIMGYVGQPRIYDSFGNVTAESVIQVDETMVSSTPGALTYAMNRVAPQLNSVTAMYFSNNATTAVPNPPPQFFSGVTFDGTLQIPYTVFGTSAQARFTRNKTAASPIPWNGLGLVKSKAGAIFQFCRFRGFAFALSSAPPYEAGSVNTNYSEGITVRRSELDGRIAAHLSPTRPRAAGGWMQNKEINIRFEDFWEHHTRRSGNAINTNTNRQDEQYYYENMQLEEIANIVATDPWPSDATSVPGGFNGWNLEAVVGTVTIVNCRANIQHNHINWVLPYQGASGTFYQAPDHVVVIVRGFKTDDTLYGGCLRIAVPNSTPTWPGWDKINRLGIDGSGLFDVEIVPGIKASGVRHSVWNSRQSSFGDAATFYPKEQFFVVIY